MIKNYTKNYTVHHKLTAVKNNLEGSWTKFEDSFVHTYNSGLLIRVRAITFVTLHSLIGPTKLALLQELRGESMRNYSRPYVGINGNGRKAFRSKDKPTNENYPEYMQIIGPFRTMKGAQYYEKHPEVLTISSAEKKVLIEGLE